MWTIIVAGGTGSRFGADVPKQFCLLNGRPVLMHTIERLRESAPGSGIVLAINADYIDLWRSQCSEHGFDSPTIVAGGRTRWESVSRALAAVPAEARVIAVHDAARPFVTAPVMHRLADAIAAGAQGAIPTVALTDSIRRLDGEARSHSVDRSQYRAVQTPQMFDAALLRKAYKAPYQSTFTDDASVMESAGYMHLTLVEGDPRNIKITHPADIDIASIYLCSDCGTQK